LVDLGFNELLMLRWVLKNYDGRAQIGLIWLGTGISNVM